MYKILGGFVCLAMSSSALQAAPRPGLEGKVFLPQDDNICGVVSNQGNELFGALLAALLPSLVQAGVKGIGGALSKAASPDETTVIGSASTNFYGTTNEFVPVTRQNCVVFVADTPDTIKGRLTINSTTDSFQNVTYQGTDGFLEKSDIEFLGSNGYTAYPLFYYVAKLETSPDKSAWRLVPTKIWIGPSLTNGGLRGKGRDLVVTASLLGAAAKDEDNVLAAKSVNIKRVVANRWYSESGVGNSGKSERFATGWIPFPAMPAQPLALLTEAKERQKSINEIKSIAPSKRTAKQVAQLTKMETRAAADPAALAKILPVNFKIQVQETRDGIKFLQKVGEFVAGNAETIAKPIAASFDGDAKREAAVKALSGAQDLKVSALEAVNAWSVANADASLSALEKQVKKIKAQTACQTLRLNDLDDPACGLVD